ncbi:MAG TPA: ThuA domain-containing protein [Candidatus Latescibacteria bacterium]|nr:ThuA domain-containing protein [Candidatus Latescibacterota bacterium]
MAKIKVLQFAGGEIHDWKGVGDEVEATLKEDSEFEVTRVNEDLNVFTTDLSAYDAVVFHYTVGSITDAQRDGLFNFVKSGKGFVGIHSAADSFRDSPEFRDFIGGYFVTHPRYRSYQVSVLDDKHPITEGLDEFVVTDEQYITDYDPRVNVLATGLYKGKAYPVIWTKSFGKGKICYNALGHDANACKNMYFKLTLVRGVKWAAATA